MGPISLEPALPDLKQTSGSIRFQICAPLETLPAIRSDPVERGDMRWAFSESDLIIHFCLAHLISPRLEIFQLPFLLILHDGNFYSFNPFCFENVLYKD